MDNTTAEIVKTVAPAVIDAFLPFAMAALTWGATALMSALRRKFEGEHAHALISHVEHASLMAVQEVEQTLAPMIREALADDGRISPDEMAELREAALQSAKRLMGAKSHAELNRMTGGQADAAIVSAIESKVHDLRSLRSSELLTVTGTAGDMGDDIVIPEEGN